MGSAHLRVIFALVAVQVLFGINYVTSKVVVTAVSPLGWAIARLAVAAVLLIGVLSAIPAWRARRPTLSGPEGKRFWLKLFGFALIGIVINQTCFLVGLRYTTATNAAILNTLIPVFTLATVTVLGRERLTGARIGGFALALAGVLALRRIEDLTLGSSTALGDLLMIINSASYGVFLVVSRRFFQEHDRLWATALLFAAGTLVLGLGAGFLPGTWEGWTPGLLTGEVIGCMVFGILGGTIATYFLNFWALARASSSSVALFIYVQPVVAALLAWSWKGETPTLRTWLSMALIFVGLLVALDLPRERPKG